MPERRRHLLRLGAAGLFAAVAIGAPAALAQTVPDPDVEPPGGGSAQSAEWDGSGFDSPDDAEGAVEVRTPTFDVSGTFRLRKSRPSTEITGATLTAVDDPSDDFEPTEGCDPEPIEFDGDGTPAIEVFDDLDFAVEDHQLPCNGRWILQATATAEDADDHTIVAELTYISLPPAVDDFDATVEDAAGRIVVEWTPLSAGDLPPDALGYAIQRAGPRSGQGFGLFETVTVAGLDARPQVADTPDGPGDYQYRVRTVRDGPDGQVLSSILGVQPVTLGFTPPTTTTTTTTVPDTTSPTGQIAPPRTPRASIPRPSAPTLSTPTTIDTGFEGTIDYGDPTTADDEPGIELAGEQAFPGQSIVQDEGAGVGYAIPVAGAMVLLGWAGHIAYVNRIAQQLQLDPVVVQDVSGEI